MTYHIQCIYIHIHALLPRVCSRIERKWSHVGGAIKIREAHVANSPRAVSFIFYLEYKKKGNRVHESLLRTPLKASFSIQRSRGRQYIFVLARRLFRLGHDFGPDSLSCIVSHEVRAAVIRSNLFYLPLFPPSPRLIGSLSAVRSLLSFYFTLSPLSLSLRSFSPLPPSLSLLRASLRLAEF